MSLCDRAGKGNCSPRFMRPTLYVAPCSNDQLNISKIPFAVVIQPFATVPDDEVSMTRSSLFHLAKCHARCFRKRSVSWITVPMVRYDLDEAAPTSIRSCSLSTGVDST